MIVKNIIINAMTAYQVYEQSVKPLSVAEKLTLARLIINEVVPDAGPHVEASGTQHNAIPRIEYAPSAKARQPREFGAGRHLLSGAGIDVDELMATSIEDMFADYMPE